MLVLKLDTLKPGVDIEKLTISVPPLGVCFVTLDTFESVSIFIVVVSTFGEKSIILLTIVDCPVTPNDVVSIPREEPIGEACFEVVEFIKRPTVVVSLLSLVGHSFVPTVFTEEDLPIFVENSNGFSVLRLVTPSESGLEVVKLVPVASVVVKLDHIFVKSELSLDERVELIGSLSIVLKF